MRSIFKTLLLSLLTVGAFGIHTAIAQKQTIICNTSTGAACSINSNPGDGSQGDPAWLFNGKSNVNFSQIFTMLGSTGTLPAPLFGLEFNNNGTLGSLLPGSTGTWCLDWTSLTAAPILISCGSGSGTVTSVGLTTPAWLSVSPSSITTSGTFAISGTIEPNNEVLASAPSGSQTALAPRALVAADIPTISASTGLSGTLQAAQEPAHTGDVTNTSGSLSMTVGKVNGLPIPPSSSLVGTNSSSQFVAVTTPLALALGGTGTASPGLVAGSNISVTGSFPNQTVNANIGSTSFSAETSGTNTQAAMVVGTGASLAATGSGTISATNTVNVNGAGVPASALVLGSNSLGQLLFETTTGTGFPVLSNSPTLVTPNIGAATATSVNGTAIPASSTLLVNGGALGTPSSATLTNATGLPTTGLTGTLQAAQEPAHTGDATNTAGSLATTVVRVNGGALPVSAPALATNSLGQIIVGGGSGTVTTSGSPVSGNIATFSGASTITSGNLSGDVTTTGTLAATVVRINGSPVPVSASVLGSSASGQLVSGTTTGSGNNVLATSPTLVTPALGTPSSLVLTNATGLPNSSVIGLGTFATANASAPPAIGSATPAAGSFSSLTDTGITGSTQCLHVNTTGLISGTGVDCGGGGGSSAFNSITSGTNTTAAMLVGTGASFSPTGSGTVTANSLSAGIALGTPGSGTLTNETGLPLTTGVTGVLPVGNGGTGDVAPSLVAGTNVTITGTWPNQTVTASSTGATSFSALTSATNTTAAMVVGTGATLAPTGSGTITANALISGIALGTPGSGTLTNATGLPISTGVSGLGTGVSAFLATPSSSNLANAITDETGSGALVFGSSPSLTSPTIALSETLSFVTGSTQCLHVNTAGLISGTGSDCSAGGSAAFSALTSATNTTAAMLVGTGASLGATGSGTITATAAPVGGITGLGTGVGTFLATPSSANLAAAVTGETGSGALVFGTSPALTTPNIGAATASALTISGISGSTQCLQVNTSGVVAGAGAGCAGTPAFSGIATGTNTTAAMTVGTGGSLTVSGTGSINATQVNGAAVPTSAAVLASNGSNQLTALTLGGNLAVASGVLQTSQSINAQTGTTYAMLTTDAGKLVTFSNAASIAVSLSQATTAGFTAGYSFDVENKGAGTVTITPATSTVNGASTLVLTQNEGCTVTSDGTNYQVSACTAVFPGGGAGFSAITAGTNTTAAMVVGSGASLTVSGTGSINANQINGATLPINGEKITTNAGGQLVAMNLVSDSPGAGPVNDYAPAGFTVATGVLYITPASGGTTLNGLLAGNNLQEVYIINAEAAGGADLIKLANQAAGSTAANRFLTSATVSLGIPPGGRVLCINLPSVTRWSCQ